MIVSIPEAAQRLNLSVDSVRRRVRSGAMSATRDERGKWWLDLPDEQHPGANAVNADARVGLGVGTPLQRNERETLITSLEAQIDDLKSRLDRSENERREDAEKFRAERDKLLAMIEHLSTGRGQ